MVLAMNEIGWEEVKDVFEGWREYPLDAIPESAALNIQSYQDRIADTRSTLFCDSTLETEVEVIDLISTNGTARALRNSFRSSEDVEQHIWQTEKPMTRIISLHSQTSLDPLKITEETCLKILSHEKIGPEFLDLLFAFGAKPRDSEAGLGGMTITTRPDGSYDMCYLLVHVEESKGKQRVSWPIRQTAVFHRFVPNSEGSLWIFINPMPNSVLQQRLERTVVHGELLSCSKDLQHLHLLVLSSYIENWRWYLKALNEEFTEIADVALTLDFSRPEDYSDGFKTLSRLQYLQERILPLSARFKTSTMTVSELQGLNTLFCENEYYEKPRFVLLSNSLKSYNTKFYGHLVSIEVLKSRVQGVLELLSADLNLKNQATSVDINHNMLLLTRDTVDDSATVRVVTLVTLIYLPASFVSSLLGMNLFTFQVSDGSGFQVSHQFWVFIVLTVPLTFLTVGAWFYIAHKRKRNKALQEREQQRQREVEV